MNLEQLIGLVTIGLILYFGYKFGKILEKYPDLDKDIDSFSLPLDKYEEDLDKTMRFDKIRTVKLNEDEEHVKGTVIYEGERMSIDEAAEEISKKF